ncbi:MAG: hypothetical protein QOE51_1256 [Actinoplanes sp.]|jgi:hypothetical protein|nr:hypothetical protein [Actinoplanes sp.]
MITALLRTVLKVGDKFKARLGARRCRLRLRADAGHAVAKLGPDTTKPRPSARATCQICLY